MARLAREANVSRTTLYRRFRSRQEVEQALRDAGVEGMVELAGPRERCLDAVGVLATTAGLARMTLEAVADEAKVGIASVYRIFGGREALLQAFALERSPRAVLEAVMLDDDAPLQTMVETLMAAVLQQVFDHAPWMGLAFAADDESRELASEFVALEREGRERLVAFMARYVDRGELSGEPRLLAEALLSLAAGRALFARADGRSPDPDDARGLARVFLDGTRGSNQ